MKASELIQGTVRRARGLDRNVYKLQSKLWHEPAPSAEGDTEPGQCFICFAGAWLTDVLEPFEHVRIQQGHMRQHVLHTCLFLNQLREEGFSGIRWHAREAGLEHAQSVENALKELGRTQPALFHYKNFHTWAGFSFFLNRMELLAQELAKRGL